MRNWLSASDLAKLGLPGMPKDKSAWTRYAEREGWLERKDEHGQPLARVVKGRGGERIEFHIDLLPAVSLAGYVAQHVGAVDCSSDEATDGKGALTIAAQEARDARLALIAAADRLARETGFSRHVADRLFAGLYALEKITVAPWVRAAVKDLSARTLARWRAHRDRGELDKLGVDKGAARRGKGKLESGEGGEVRAFLLAAIARQPHLSADHLKTLCEDKFPSVKSVSLRSFQRMRAKIERENKVVLTKVTNPDAFRSRYRLTGSNSHPVSRLNELWQIDASPADALCVDGRHSVYLCVDVFSRRLIVYVSRTPRSEAVQLLIRRAIMAWGVPERVHTDNGSDFVAKSTQRLFAALGIEVELSRPFQPQEKGHVERAVKTFQHDLAPLLPGFVGHNVKDRKVIEERRAFAARLGQDDAGAFKAELTATELQTICDDWAMGRYANRPHAGLDGATPFQTAAAFNGLVRRIEDVRALDLLLAPIAGGGGVRQVTKKGVRIDGAYFIAPTVMPETRVFVRMDPEDMGRAWLFSEDQSEFLGEAICYDRAGVDPKAALVEARAQQKRLIEAQADELRAGMRKLKPRDMIDVVVRKAAAEAGKLVEFPKREVSYMTPAIAAAGEAAGTAAPRETPASSPSQSAVDDPRQRYRRAKELEARLANNEAVSPEDTAWLSGYRLGHEYRSMSEFEHKFDDKGSPTPVYQLPPTKQMRFRRALALEARLARNERLENDESMWLDGYQQGAEYRAMAVLFEDFGEDLLREANAD